MFEGDEPSALFPETQEKMWCSTCQQDVPAIASPGDRTVCCARCQGMLPGVGGAGRKSRGKAARAHSHSEARSASSPLPELDDWQLEDDLRDAEYLLRKLGQPLDRPRHPDSTPPPEPAQPPRGAARPQEPRTPVPSSFVSGCILALGLTILVIGTILLGLSFATNSPELWRVGMPLTIASQAILAIGLVLHLWRSHRQANRTLSELDAQIGKLRHTLSLLNSSASSRSQSFYVHMAEQASPHVLLADLRGQLDLLAARLSEQRD